MTVALLVALAAGAGAVLRAVVDAAVRRRTDGAFPWGTAVVNVAGSLLLGVVVGLAERGVLAAGVATVLGVGLAGGLTTLSTWAVEALGLARAGAGGSALLDVVGTLVACLAAVGAGLLLAGL